MRKLLHIAPNEKFIDYIISEFESLINISNQFIILNNGQNFVKSTNREIRFVSTLNSNEINLNEYHAVFIHYLDDKKADFIRESQYFNFVWLPWGKDIYESHPKLKGLLYQKQTEKLLWRISFKKQLKEKIKDLLSTLGIKKSTYIKQETALKKIKYIAPVIDEDFELIKSLYKNSHHCEKVDFTYGNINTFTNQSTKLNGNNILLGNSASATNNHLEIIKLLSKINLKKHKVICPLNYGEKQYAEEIAKIGYQELGNNFYAILEFLPLEKYLEIISSCEFVIMNINRQQAMGNIYAMLFLGSKIFIKEDSPVYNFLKRNQFFFGLISEIERDRKLTPLTPFQKKHNSLVVKDLISENVTKKRLIDLIKTISS